MQPEIFQKKRHYNKVTVVAQKRNRKYIGQTAYPKLIVNLPGGPLLFARTEAHRFLYSLPRLCIGIVIYQSTLILAISASMLFAAWLK